jgi:hypothetical protein
MMAAAATARARATRTVVRQNREAWARWRAAWTEAVARPNHLLVCCAYCWRMRRDSGEWVEVPAEVSEALQHVPSAEISHSFCPECIARHDPRQSDSGGSVG